MAELTGYQIDLERRPRGHASLADLTRTLEVLEQRLDRVSQTRQEKRRSAQPRGETQAAGRSTLRTLAQETPASRPSYQAEAPQPRRRRPASLNDAVSEIVMRQKVLDRQPASQARQGAETRRDHRSIERPARSLALPAVETTVYAAENDAHRRRSTTSRAPAFEGREADDRVHPKSSSVEELRAELIRLREELGRDLASGVAGQVEDMRRAFADLRETIADKASVERIDEEIGRVHDGLEKMANTGVDRNVIADMRDELDDMRQLVAATAREESLEAVARRWESFEEAQTNRDDQAHETKRELHAELGRLRDSLSRLASEDQIRAVEQRWVDFEDRVVAEMGASDRSSTFADRLSNEMESLRQQLASLASEQSIHAVDTRLGERLGAIEDRFASRDEMDATVRTLTDRLAHLEESLATLPEILPFDSLDQRIGDLSKAIDRISARAEANDSSDRFAQVEDRLDEITRAIVAVSERRPEIDLAPVERLEARLQALAARVDDLANDGTAALLAERLAEMTARIEEIGAPDPFPAEIGEQIDRLTRRLDEISLSDGGSQRDITALETRIASLAERIEEQLAAPREDGAAMRSLQEQIARIAEVVNSDGFGTGSGLERRMDDLERRVDANADNILIAAKAAADEAVRQILEQGDVRQGEHVARLSDELSKLQQLSKDTTVRSKDFFEAVNAALSRVVDRIDAIENDMSRAPAPEAAWNRETTSSTASHAMAAHAAAAAVAETDREEDDTGPKGLRALLSRNFKGTGRKEVPAQERWNTEPSPSPRHGQTVARDDVPSLDASDVFDSPEANRPLAIGSGTPDIAALLERVRNQKTDTQHPAEEGAKADFIAAARRAAMAAAEEAEHYSEGTEEESRSGGIGQALARRRKPIMLAASAVLLALLALPAGKFVAEQTGLIDDAPLVEREMMSSSSEAMSGGGTQQNETGRSTEPDTQSVEPESTMTPPRAPNVAPAEASDVPAVAPEQTAAVAEIAESSRPGPTRDAAGLGDPPVTSAAFTPPAPTQATATTDETSAAASVGTVRYDDVVNGLPEGIGPTPLLEAAKAGDPKALFEIGLRLMEGRTVSSDPTKAAEWFERSAKLGFAPAQYSLGTLYEKGNGVARDTIKARDWYLKAAEAGNVRAMHNLAVLFATGVDGKSEPEQAARWFVDAAEHGMTDSQYNLGILYARGAGVDQNMAESYKWFSIVGAAGDQDAVNKRDEVAKALSEQELAKAKAEVASFKVADRNEEANTVDIPSEWTAAADRPTTTSSIDMKRAVRNIQAILTKLGYEPGVPDGVIGDKTTAAIKSFQKDAGLQPSGAIDEALIRALLERKDG